MKPYFRRIGTAMAAGTMILGILSACGTSSEPCEDCGDSPTRAYKNEATGENEYYCEDCASDCAFCSGTATRHYTSGLRAIVFVCDDCYKEIQEMNA